MVVLQQLSLAPGLAVTVTFLLLAGRFGKALLLRLLFRSRWLFLTMGLLFLWLSPGVRLPPPWGNLGMTQEGLVFALEHMGRLAAMLALLALLLTKLSHRGIVSGFYVLLSPLALFPLCADLRRAMAVRLMLTLEAVAGKVDSEWKSLLLSDDGLNPPPGQGAGVLHLESPHWSWRDGVLTLAALVAAALLPWLLERL